MLMEEDGMSVRRLLGTAAGMAVIAAALAALTPPMPETLAALATAQRTADTAGADVLVLHVAASLAWLVWSWGALGLTLTALSALPGLAGTVAEVTLGRLLPRGARSVAAFALGIGLGVTAPVLVVPLVAAPPAVAEELPADPAPSTANVVPDWPATTAAAPTASAPLPAHTAQPAADRMPDWPRAPSDGEHVVVRGDCLWQIAERRLATDVGRAPSAAEVATAVDAWWLANAEVIGPDPDRLLPGQVLRPPALP